MFVNFCTVLLFCSRFSYQHPAKRQTDNSADDNFVFATAEIVTTIKLSDSTEVYVEAYKTKGNDDVLKHIGSNPWNQGVKSGIGTLRFLSVGYPTLIVPTNIDQTDSKRATIPYFVLTASGFAISIRTLTDDIRKALASAATTQYQVKIGSDQIFVLNPTSLTCDMTITTENNTYSMRGNLVSFNTNPIKVDFKVPMKSVERSLLDSPSLKAEMLSITCEVIKRVQTSQTDTLIITSGQLDKLDLQQRLIGTADRTFVTRHQLTKLSKEIQQTLNIQENYEATGSFNENFFKDILDNFGGKETFQAQPVQDVLKYLSPYKIDEIYKELSSELNNVGSGSRHHFLFAEKQSHQGNRSSDKNNKTTSDKGWKFLSAIESIAAAKANWEEWAFGRKSLDEQLKELNEHSQSDVKWEQQGNTIVPKSLVVMQISSTQLSQSLVFSRIRRKLTATDYRKEFRLDIAAIGSILHTSASVTSVASTYTTAATATVTTTTTTIAATTTAPEITTSRTSDPPATQRIGSHAALPLPSTTASTILTSASVTPTAETLSSTYTTSTKTTTAQAITPSETFRTVEYTVTGRYGDCYKRRCQTSTDCCSFNTQEYIRIESCGREKYCSCVEPGDRCEETLRCCDGSVCNGQCPLAGLSHSCHLLTVHSCQSGLICTSDGVTMEHFPERTGVNGWHGRCLPADVILPSRMETTEPKLLFGDSISGELLTATSTSSTSTTRA